MRSLQFKLLLAFLAVALVATGVLGLLLGRATSGAFNDYLSGQAMGSLSSMRRMMDEMMGPGVGQDMLAQMIGPAERAYISAVQSAVWVAGGIAVLVAIGVSLVLARQIAAPARALNTAARRMAAGDYNQRVAVRSSDEVGQLASAFNALAEALAHQQALRRQMAADVAHELRTPLAVMQANLEALLDGVRPLTLDVVAEIHQETQVLSRLIADLRDLSLAEAGRLPLQREPTDVRLLAQESVVRFETVAMDKGVRLRVEVADELPLVDVDPDRIGQVLGNLLDNAVRHTPRGGAVIVAVRCAAQPHTVEVTVHDTGSGIPPEHLPNIFERFYRVDQARSRAGGGSGIGLAVVKQIVKAHGGQVWAASAAGHGTRFGLIFPVATRQAQAAALTPSANHARRNGRVA